MVPFQIPLETAVSQLCSFIKKEKSFPEQFGMGSSRCLLPSYLNKQAKWKNKLYFFTSGTKLPLLLKVHMLPLLCLVVRLRCLPSFCKATCVIMRKDSDCFSSPRASLYRNKQSPRIGNDIRWCLTQPPTYLLVVKQQQDLMLMIQLEN